MPADLELGAAITVEDTSELDGLTADVAPQGGDSGGATGGDTGGGGGIMDMLGQMTGLLKIATVALGVIMAVPGLLSGVMRLLEVALLPIGILFQSLLAPLIQRLLKWLVQNDIIGMVQRFAQKIVTAITNFIADLQPLINGIQNIVNQSGETVDEAAEQTPFAGVASGETTGAKTAGAVTGFQAFASGNGIIAPAISELSAAAWDEYVGESSNGQTQEEGPS